MVKIVGSYGLCIVNLVIGRAVLHIYVIHFNFPSYSFSGFDLAIYIAVRPEEIYS